MSFFLDYFKPAPHIPPIKEPHEQNKQYYYWRIRILYTMFIGYGVYYFTRGTLAISMPQLKQMGYDEVYLGWLITFFQVSYGISKFVNGLIADRANPRFFMALGLVLSGLVSIAFGMTNSIICFLFFWTLNGWFQGFGSAPCHRLLSHWYSPRERGRWWSVWNTSHNAGAAILPLMGAYLLIEYGWQSVMIVPGVIAIFIGLFLVQHLRDTPQSLGLPPVEVFRNDHKESIPSSGVEKEFSYKEILWKHVLSNKWIWILSVSYFMVYVIRWTISHWAFYFLVESRGYAVWDAAKCIGWYEIGGFIGGIAAGWLSDISFKGNRTIVNLLFFSGLIPSLYAFSNLTATFPHPVLTQTLMGLIGFFIFGPQMLLAVHSVEITHKKASATAVGFLGIIAYLGSAITGGPLGYLVQHCGWQYVFVLLEVCACIGIISTMSLFFMKKTRSFAISGS